MFNVPPLIWAIVILFSASAFFFAQSLIPSKSDVSKKLEELEGLKWDAQQGGRQSALEKIFSEDRRGKLKSQLQEAGWYRVTPTKMVARTLSGGLFGLTCGMAVCLYMNDFFDLLPMVAVLVFTVGGAYLPMSQLKSAVKKRKIAIQKGLPDLLDLLATTVQAGLAFNQALGYAEQASTGALHEELSAVLSEIRLGRSRAEAMRSMADRVRQQDLSTTVTAIIQAERLGSNLSEVLTELSEEARNRRMMRAEEIAALMPIKMVIPMALFMLPALFVMIFGGVVAQFMTTNH
jgi:tight adherence protein C